MGRDGGKRKKEKHRCDTAVSSRPKKKTSSPAYRGTQEKSRKEKVKKKKEDCVIELEGEKKNNLSTWKEGEEGRSQKNVDCPPRVGLIGGDGCDCATL